ncbi:hypothetical protein HaLaN_09721, partial [Haematococcus lacustris]
MADLHQREAELAAQQAQVAEAQQRWEEERCWQAAQDREARSLLAMELQAARLELEATQSRLKGLVHSVPQAEAQLQELTQQ